MEAATPLRQAHVRTIGDRLAIDGLVLQDECAVGLVREREEAGDDPVRAVADAIEIGARVLDREQAGANADFVRSEFDRTARDVETAFTERAKEVADELGRSLEEVFDAERGHLPRALERHFSDESDAAVQNRVRDVLGEVMAKTREDLLKQFSSADGSNPLAEFKARTVEALRAASDQQVETLRGVEKRMADLQVELQALRDQREKDEELDEERERGTAKGRTFEESVFEAVEAIAAAQGDDCDAVGDLRGATGKTGDVVVAIDACSGPPPRPGSATRARSSTRWRPPSAAGWPRSTSWWRAPGRRTPNRGPSPRRSPTSPSSSTEAPTAEGPGRRTTSAGGRCAAWPGR